MKSPTDPTFRIVLESLTFPFDSHYHHPSSYLNLYSLSYPFYSLQSPVTYIQRKSDCANILLLLKTI